MSIPDKDYSNTIIYKITCKDPSIQDVYVGHTVNFVQRKKAHRRACMNSKYPNHNCKVYKVMRNNGGWDNWNMDIVAFYKCNDLDEARQKEQEHFVALNATMNSVEPFPSKHVNRIIHVNPLTVNNPTYNENLLISTFNQSNCRYKCENCYFITSNKKDYRRHMLSRKHLDLNPETSEDTDYPATNTPSIPIKPTHYQCQYCNKRFKSRTTIYQHKAKCQLIQQKKQQQESETNYIVDSSSITSSPTHPHNPVDGIVSSGENMIINQESFMTLLKNNQEMMNNILRILSEKQNTTNNTANTPFNMNRFLNEQCKDAMNMTDFVNSIQLTLTDLENVGRLGYAKGMSNILIDNLQKTDLYKRPVHCSDAKRETLYVKDNNEWERDGPDHPKMANAIRVLEEKNDALIEEWANQHPNCINDHTRDNKQYLKIRNAITLGNIAKVIHRVAKTIVIEK